jgi:hypothetical protein
MAESKSDLPVRVNVGSALGLAVAEALPRCLEIVLEGRQVRANIEMAVRAIEVSHELRLRAVDELERMLTTYFAAMTPAVRNEFFLAISRLLADEHYALPWGKLLPGR